MKPLLVLVNGPCGVGKTTFAKELQKQIPHSLLIEGDELRRWFEDHPKDRAASAERLTELIIHIASAQVKTGYTVIFDKTIAFEGVVKRICSRVGSDNVIELVLELPETEIHSRIKVRGGYGRSLSKEKAKHFIEYFKDYTPGAEHSIFVDASKPDVSKVAEKVTELITI